MPVAPRYLLDTNICIYIAKKHPPSIAKRFAELENGAVAMSLITYGELRFGAEKSMKRQQTIAALDQLQSLIPVLEPRAEVGETYGRLRATLENNGTPIGNNDLWIAAHALSLGLTLVSNNTQEFQRIAELSLEDWA